MRLLSPCLCYSILKSSMKHPRTLNLAGKSFYPTPMLTELRPITHYSLEKMVIWLQGEKNVVEQAAEQEFEFVQEL